MDFRALDTQFQYAFVVDRESLKVMDITHSIRPQVVESSFLPIPDAQRIYVAQTYAYIVAGKR
ncbi:MAG: hypothetical protein NZ805_01110 [Armatimonadetes bacterium]|nr:hypothetical protein [Armatimonadota bacterium]MDW8027488.1 hypothetical protein [Armatimonadota bacterium]